MEHDHGARREAADDTPRHPTTERTVRHGDVTLHWEERGPADGETILLVMGLGAQLIAWRDGFCDLLADQGYRVIRFDNRDAGLSSRTPGTPLTIPELATLLGPKRTRRPVPYSLSDMAADGMAILDEAGVRRGHVVGASLGGMIAQTIAIEHRERVLSLTSIMSKPGSMFAGLPTPRVLRTVIRTTPVERDAAIAYELERAAVTCGPLFDREAMAAFLAEAYDRSPDRTGMAFQLAAILSAEDRTPALRRLDVPTLVIHGRADGLVRLSGGIATARAVPGAELVVHNQMGHDLPRALWPSLTDSIVGHARRSVAARAARVGFGGAPSNRGLVPTA